MVRTFVTIHFTGGAAQDVETTTEFLAVVGEPTSLALLGVSLAGLGFGLRRRRS